MRLLCFFILLTLSFPILTRGQAKWQLENIHGSVGWGLGGNNGFTWMDLKNQSKDPSFPDYSTSGLVPSHGLIDIRLDGLISASITAGFYPYSKKRKEYNGRKEWQVGIFYNYIAMAGPMYQNQRHYPYPPPDTMNYLYLKFNERRQYLGITNSITLRTNPESRMNVFGGATLTTGVGVAGKINAYSAKSMSVITDSGSYRVMYNVEENSHYQTYSATLLGVKVFDGLGIRFLHHYYFSIQGGFDFGPVFFYHSSTGGEFFLFESADLSIPLNNYSVKKKR